MQDISTFTIVVLNLICIIFQIFFPIRYSYSDEIQISTENVNNMLYAADKYMLSTIKTKCCELLKSTAQSSDAVVTLSTANRFHLEVLQKESLHYIEENTEECLLSSHAVQMNSECVEIIISSEYLSCSETEVCKFFLKWVDAQCKLQGKEVNADNLKAIAGGLMAFIKFPLVEKTYFSSEVSHSLLLTKEEVISVFRSHHGDKCLLFSDKPRCSSSDLKTVCLYRSTNVSKPWTSTAVNALKFCSSKSIWIKGCIIFGPVFDPVIDDLTFRFELIDNSENVICDEVLDMRTNTSVNNTIAIKLMKQTRLKANEKYTIMVRNIKPSTYYGIDCKSICNQEGISVIFENSPKSQTNTDVNHGQIAGIIFSI